MLYKVLTSAARLLGEFSQRTFGAISFRYNDRYMTLNVDTYFFICPSSVQLMRKSDIKKAKLTCFFMEDKICCSFKFRLLTNNILHFDQVEISSK